MNCLPAHVTERYVSALASAVAGGDVLVGAYANAGRPDATKGWEAHPGDPALYGELAFEWRSAGARIIGGCCGTGPAHVAAVRETLGLAGRRPPADPSSSRAALR